MGLQRRAHLRPPLRTIVICVDMVQRFPVLDDATLCAIPAHSQARLAELTKNDEPSMKPNIQLRSNRSPYGRRRRRRILSRMPRQRELHSIGVKVAAIARKLQQSLKHGIDWLRWRLQQPLAWLTRIKAGSHLTLLCKCASRVCHIQAIDTTTERYIHLPIGYLLRLREVGEVCSPAHESRAEQYSRSSAVLARARTSRESTVHKGKTTCRSRPEAS